MVSFFVALALLAPNVEAPLILVEQHAFPYLNLTLYFRGGPIFDPPGKAGLSALTNRLLLRGTASMGRAELEEAIEGLGTELVTSTQRHAVSLGGSVLRRNLNRYVELLTDVVAHPRLSQIELDKTRREMIAELESTSDDDSALGRRWFRRLLFPNHRLGNGVYGTRATLESITREDVLAHHKRVYTNARLQVVASGAVDQKTLGSLLAPLLSALPAGEKLDWALPARPNLKGRHVVLVDKAARSQVQIFMGHPALDAADPDFYALNLATTAFGGTFTSRLMQEVRVKRGLSYGAYARVVPERVGGYFMLTAAPEAEDAVKTLDLLFKEYSRFVDEGLSDDEIEFARGYIINAFPFSLETPTLRAAQQARATLLGRPADFVKTYVERIKALTPDQIRETVKRRLRPNDLLVIMVCSAPPLRDAIAKIPGVDKVTVTPFSDEPPAYE